jgi:mono/diheme cytochrome c family protein
MDYKKDDFNKGGLIAFMGSVIFCLGFFVYIAFIHPGVDLKEIPEATAGGDLNLAANTKSDDPDVSKIAKPWEENADMLAHGKHVFKTNCEICHGSEGKGDGPAGKALVPPPRNFVEGKWKKGGSSAELFVTLQNGLAGSSMASFKHLPKVDRWAVIQYIRSITQNKIKDDAAKLEAFAKTAD